MYIYVYNNKIKIKCITTTATDLHPSLGMVSEPHGEKGTHTRGKSLFMCCRGANVGGMPRIWAPYAAQSPS